MISSLVLTVWWEGDYALQCEVFLPLLLVDFYGIFFLLKAPAESDGSVPYEGDEGQTTEEQFLGEVSVAF